jgi:hypothetical protein
MDVKSFALLNHNVIPLQKWQASLPFETFQPDAGDGSKVVNVMRAIKPNAEAEVVFPATCYPPTEYGSKLLRGFELIVVATQ